mgnify:FL=1
MFFTISSLFTILSTLAYSADCSLNGVRFQALSQLQIDAMKGAGAKCTESQIGAFSYGQEGYYIINGQKTEASDVSANDPYDMAGNEATFFGYISTVVYEWPRQEVFVYRFDAYLDEGEFLEHLGYVRGGSFLVPLVFAGDQNNDTVESAKADRIKFFKALKNAKEQKAVVKVTGTFRVFSNSGDLYMQGVDIEIIQEKP